MCTENAVATIKSWLEHFGYNTELTQMKTDSSLFVCGVIDNCKHNYVELRQKLFEYFDTAMNELATQSNSKLQMLVEIDTKKVELETQMSVYHKKVALRERVTEYVFTNKEECSSLFIAVSFISHKMVDNNRVLMFEVRISQ